MLKILLAIFRRRHITNEALRRALENARQTPTTQPKIIEIFTELDTRQTTNNQPAEEEKPCQ